MNRFSVRIQLSGKVIHPVRLVKTNCTTNITFQAFPNPLQSGVDKLTLKFAGTSSGTAVARLYNNAGQIILEKRITVIEGVNTQQLSIPHLSAGMYYIILNNLDGKLVGREQLMVTDK